MSGETPAPIPQSDMKRQYHALQAELRGAVDRVLESGWFILGRELEAFEEEFAAYCGASHAVGVGNGTDALQLALQAAGVGHGDEVVVPDNTAFPTAIAVTACGATPVFADVDPVTANLDASKIAERISPRTRAVVPVHLYGFPADLDAIGSVAREHGLALVEDCAQAHGTRYRGRKVGTTGSMGTFSFYPSKNLGAYGDAGAVITNDAELAGRLRMLRNYGQTRRYYHAVKGYNSRLDELQAAILRVKLPHLDDWIALRRDRAALYRRALEGLPVEVPEMPDHGEHTYHLFVVRCERRDELIEHLGAHGVQALVHYPVPLHRQEAFAELGYPASSHPVTEHLAGRILSLPMFPELRDEEIGRVADLIRRFYGGS